MHGVQLWNICYNKIYYEEDDLYYINYVLLPGMNKSYIDVNTIIEKDFFTIEIVATATPNYSWLHKGTKEDMKMMEPIKIVKCIKDVKTEEKVKIEMDNGLLMIKIPKKYPIKREQLIF